MVVIQRVLSLKKINNHAGAWCGYMQSNQRKKHNLQIESNCPNLETNYYVGLVLLVVKSTI